MLKTMNDSSRYKLLIKQFHLDSSNYVLKDKKRSLNRIFIYIYNYTNITYIEFIDARILYNYIKFHQSRNFEEISFVESVRDIKNYIFFIKNNVDYNGYIPKVDLSLYTFSLGDKLKVF